MKVTFKRIACMIGLLMAVGFRASFRFQDTRRRSSALKDAAYPDHTLWPVIYDKKNLTSTICFDRNWDSPLSFSIDTK